MSFITKHIPKYSAYTNLDADDNAMLKAHAYKAMSDGKVSAYSANFPNQGIIRVYVGTTSNPAGAGELIEYQSGSEIAQKQSVSARVPKGYYFEITDTDTTPTIRWQSEGRLKKPVDYN